MGSGRNALTIELKAEAKEAFELLGVLGPEPLEAGTVRPVLVTDRDPRERSKSRVGGRLGAVESGKQVTELVSQESVPVIVGEVTERVRYADERRLFVLAEDVSVLPLRLFVELVTLLAVANDQRRETLDLPQ